MAARATARLPRLRPGGRQLARGPPRALHPPPARRPVGRDGRRLRQRGARRRPRAVRPVRRGGGPPQRLPRRGGLRPRLRRAHRRRLRLAAVAARATGCAAPVRHRRASSPRPRLRTSSRRPPARCWRRVLDDTSLVGDAWSLTDGHGRPPGGRRSAAGDPAVTGARRRRAAPARPCRRGPLGCPRAGRRAGRRGPRHLGCARPRRAPSPHRRRHPRHAGAADGRARASVPSRSPGGWPPTMRWCLATTERCELQETGFEAVQVGEKGLRDLERWCDVFLFQGWVMAGRDYLGATDKVVSPTSTTRCTSSSSSRATTPRGSGAASTPSATPAPSSTSSWHGPTSCCAPAPSSATSGWASWPAWAASTPSSTTATSRCAPCWRSCPSAWATDRPRRPATRSAAPSRASARTTRSILWGGGVYNWFDPLTLVRAVDRLRQRLPTVRLLFLGMRHPNPGIPEMRMAVETQRLAEELGLVDQHVFFNRDVGRLRGPPELPARRRRRRQHPPRPHRDGVLLPHPDPRLPLGRAADRRHRRRLLRRGDRP